MDKDSLNQYEQLFKKLENHLEELKNINLLIEEIQKEKSSLEKFYYNDWLNLYENQSNGNYKILEEDRIHNLLQDLYSQEIILLKKIVSNIN